MLTSAGTALRATVAAQEPLSFVGIYDVFSASLAAREHEALFVSGFGFAASHYGLPDVGFIAWTDMVAFVERLRAVLPRHHLLVDMDDGYGDATIASHVVTRLERAGASGVVLEDQSRPRRCGHFDGKQLLPLDEYLVKLRSVLAARRDLLVVARTDASEPEEIIRRVDAFAAAGADAVLVDGVRDLTLLDTLSARLHVPLAFNQIAGGKTPPCSLTELRSRGVGLVIYSTPCLFAAQEAITAALRGLAERDGRLLTGPSHVGVSTCTALLDANLAAGTDQPRARSASHERRDLASRAEVA